jgi:hypothetical protein
MFLDYNLRSLPWNSALYPYISASYQFHCSWTAWHDVSRTLTAPFRAVAIYILLWFVVTSCHISCSQLVCEPNLGNLFSLWPLFEQHLLLPLALLLSTCSADVVVLLFSTSAPLETAQDGEDMKRVYMVLVHSPDTSGSVILRYATI